MEYSILMTILIIGLSQVSEGSVVYYVLPTEPLSSCPTNITCPPNQVCHTMDYLVKHRSDFFFPGYCNISLIFMCGIHNYTQDLHVQNLHSFVMKGETGAKENTIISMLPQMNNAHAVCTQIYFANNVKFVDISTLTLHCPSIVVEGGLLTIADSNLYGHKSTSKLFSNITVTSSNSGALLHNCTFNLNCFIVSNMSNHGITVHNCTFQSYWHETGSVLVAYSSVVKLTGFVSFSETATGIYRGNYSSGAAIFLRTTHPKLQSMLEITNNAMVYFINSSCSVDGGAVYVENGAVNIGSRATVVYMHNRASNFGGALFLNSSTLNINNSKVLFAYNVGHGCGGGAIGLEYGKLNINTGASVSFSNNTASSEGGAILVHNGALNISTGATVTFSNNAAVYSYGGAIYLYNSTIYVDTEIVFYNNTAVTGGAIHFYYGRLNIYFPAVVRFIKNTAQLQGGAIFIETGNHSSIIVGNSSKLILANNSAYQGGAIYVIPSSFAIEVRYESSTEFVYNTATDVGGAVYSEVESALPCLFLVMDFSAKIAFTENTAYGSIGEHIYGSSIRQAECDGSHLRLTIKNAKPYSNCDISSNGHVNFTINPNLKETMSPVSSAPWRVCLCDSLGRPQCANLSQIFTSVNIYRGETFSLSVITVGYDFGTTVGSVHSEFLYSNHSSQLEHSQYDQLVNSSERCTSLNYTVYTSHEIELLQLQTSISPSSIYVNKDDINYYSYYKEKINSSVRLYRDSNDTLGCIVKELLTTPVFINITLLSGCPPGLTLIENLNRCSCYPILASNGFQCLVQNKAGYLKWSTAMWVNATYNESQNNGIIYNHFCPLHYCMAGEKMLRISDDSNEQCVFNRTGILCGACRENFSLAIGSSRCIECHGSHNLSLLLMFAAAGVLLVFFILALNLTVTQGLINGLIFYANIVWVYNVVFTSAKARDPRLFFLQVFVAWLNLDFGIEACFFTGLNAYWKTWLQFLFPFYIWVIAGVIIVACRYSSRLTNLIGSRAVPLLATLFLLSYMKLLRTITDAASVAVITQYPQNTSYMVWYLDGNLRYCQHPHIYLFIAAIATLIFLWFPYTLLLLFIQPLRRVSHLRLLKWINRFTPVYDAYFSPLKNKHQYWFGTMLLIRGILLVIMIVTAAANPKFTVFILSVIIIVLVIIMSVKNVYKKMMVRVLEGAVLMNLFILSVGTLYKWESTKSKTTLLAVSIGFAFAQFCIIAMWNLIKVLYTFCASLKCRQSHAYDIVDEGDFTHERIEDPELEAVHVMVPAKNTTAVTLTY